jgi:hypothetical protein
VNARVGAEGRRDRGVQLSFAGDADPCNRRFESVADIGIEGVDGCGDLSGIHTNHDIVNTVKLSRVALQGGLTFVPHLGDERCGGLTCHRNVNHRTRDQVQQFSASRLKTAQVNCLDCGLDHGDTSLSPGVAGSATWRR